MYYTGIGVTSPMDSDVLTIMRVAVHMKKAGYTLRSGRAQGADGSFEYGAQGRADVYLPWYGYGEEHRNVHSKTWSRGNGIVVHIARGSRATQILKDIHMFITKEEMDPEDGTIKAAHRYIMALLGREEEKPSKTLVYVSYEQRTLSKTNPLNYALQAASLLKIPTVNIAQMKTQEAIAAVGTAVNFKSNIEV